jgi:hypothetical protein
MMTDPVSPFPWRDKVGSGILPDKTLKSLEGDPTVSKYCCYRALRRVAPLHDVMMLGSTCLRKYL